MVNITVHLVKIHSDEKTVRRNYVLDTVEIDENIHCII